MTRRRPTATALDDFPLMLTVPEAGAILRVGRTTAYQQAELYLATGGREGLPVIRVGHQLRVPRTALAGLTELRISAQEATIALLRSPAGSDAG